MLDLRRVSFYILAAVGVSCQSQQRFNPTIIQDTRLEPKVDGTFGFLYRTEDGISHAAKGDPNGYIQGSYSYKDPTGLKVNFNYFAGAKKSSNSVQAPVSQPQYSERQPQYREPQYNSQPETPQEYYAREPETYQQVNEYRPRTRPPLSYSRPQEYRPVYEPEYTRRSSLQVNEVNDADDYQYRG